MVDQPADLTQSLQRLLNTTHQFASKADGVCHTAVREWIAEHQESLSDEDRARLDWL